MMFAPTCLIAMFRSPGPLLFELGPVRLPLRTAC